MLAPRCWPASHGDWDTANVLVIQAMTPDPAAQQAFEKWKKRNCFDSDREDACRPAWLEAWHTARQQQAREDAEIANQHVHDAQCAAGGVALVSCHFIIAAAITRAAEGTGR